MNLRGTTLISFGEEDGRRKKEVVLYHPSDALGAL
jgi:hypothetical protein